MHTVRTSLLLPASLRERLHLVSKQEGTSISRLVRDLVDQGLAAREAKQLGELYAVWDDVCGVIKDPVADTSQRIDDILYSEDRVWKGSAHE